MPLQAKTNPLACCRYVDLRFGIVIPVPLKITACFMMLTIMFAIKSRCVSKVFLFPAFVYCSHFYFRLFNHKDERDEKSVGKLYRGRPIYLINSPRENLTLCVCVCVRFAKVLTRRMRVVNLCVGHRLPIVDELTTICLLPKENHNH